MTGKVALITGAGALGPKHAEAIIECGGTAVITDHHIERAEEKARMLNDKYGPGSAVPYWMDVTNKESISAVVNDLDRLDVLINNAAKDPKVKKEDGLSPASRFETMTEDYWFAGVDAALNGTFSVRRLHATKCLSKELGVLY